MRARLRSLPRREGGFTLPELLIASSTMLLVAVVGFGLLTTVTRMQPEVSERAAEIQQARVMIERISRELRQGYGIDSATPSRLVLLTYSRDCGITAGTGAVACRVTYSCASGACTRQADEPNETPTSPATELVSGLASDQVFEPATAYLGISISFPAVRGDDSVTLSDGVALRNVAGGA